MVKCVSHAFTEAESRWKTLEQEAFAVVFTLLHFRNVLWGHHFMVETDHRNLTFIHAGTSAKVIRWSLAVQQFSFVISFIPGDENVVADALSRAPAGAALSVQVLRATGFAGPATRTRGRHRSQQGAGVSVASKNVVKKSSENSDAGNCSEIRRKTLCRILGKILRENLRHFLGLFRWRILLRKILELVRLVVCQV